ncbi:MAG: hypothetical protein QOH42_2534 [Blastocatellia bacterium]|nr:hypothetical protein [Blastocatellia bacterium]
MRGALHRKMELIRNHGLVFIRGHDKAPTSRRTPKSGRECFLLKDLNERTDDRETRETA